MADIYNINDLVEGLSKWLKDLYPEFKVYDYDPTQDLQIPCFVIKVVNESFKRRIGRMHKDGIRGFDNVMLSIHTICKEGEYYKLREVTQNIRIRLNQLETKRGNYRTYAINDNYSEFESTLLFRVKVSTYVAPDDEPRMDRLSLDEKIK